MIVHDRSLIGRAAQAQPADGDRAVAAAGASFDDRRRGVRA
ncbi:hypothetical protein ABZ016_28000 [Streptomyces sp. NPDC006372]